MLLPEELKWCCTLKRVAPTLASSTGAQGICVRWNLSPTLASVSFYLNSCTVAGVTSHMLSYRQVNSLQSLRLIWNQPQLRDCHLVVLQVWYLGCGPESLEVFSFTARSLITHSAKFSHYVGSITHVYFYKLIDVRSKLNEIASCRGRTGEMCFGSQAAHLPSRSRSGRTTKDLFTLEMPL